jgi:alcohol dehydrogenase class IV
MIFLLTEFKFCGPSQIIFAPNAHKQLGSLVKELDGSKVFVITDPGIAKVGILDKVLEVLREAGIETGFYDQVVPEPPIETVQEIASKVKEGGFDLVVGLGGGSSMDMAKVVAVLQTNDNPIESMVGIGNVKKRGIPMIAMPTTAGTGSEVTQIAIFTFEEEKTKKGIVSPYLFATAAIVDPVFTYGLPPHITANTGMDALVHAIEGYIAKKSNPISDMYALQAIGLISKYLRKAVHNGENAEARYYMSLGSLEAGLSFSNSSCAAVHALAYPLGGTFHIPHGLSNTLMLKSVMEFNVVTNIERFVDIAVAMGENVEGLCDRDAALKAIKAMGDLAEDICVPTRLRDVDIPKEAIPKMAEDAAKQQRLLSQNPRKLSVDDIRKIYENAW